MHFKLSCFSQKVPVDKLAKPDDIINPMPKLSQSDQFKLLREEFRDLKMEIRRSSLSKYNLQDDIKILKTDVRDLQKTWEKAFFKFRSELFDKIDGFVGRIKSQDEEIGTINVRVSRLEKPIQAMVA